MRILVSGSASLDEHRKMGDSLTGRYFVHHMLPFSLAELVGTDEEGNLKRLLERGGFPEPFLATNVDDALRWRTLYTESMLRTDVLDFASVSDMRAMRDVFELLRRGVGVPVSYSSLSRSVGISPATVKRYIAIFEALYLVFLVRPYTRKIARATLKEPKIYFFDTVLVTSEGGARLENLVALSLLKQVQYRADARGLTGSLGYLRTKEGKEADFTLADEAHELTHIIEVKQSDHAPSKNLLYFSGKYNVPGVQIVGSLRNDFVAGPVRIADATRYLKGLEA